MKSFEVTPPSQFAYWLPLGSLILSMVGIALAVALGGTEDKPTTELLWLLPALIVAGPLLLLVMRRRQVTFDGAALVVRATLHTTRIAVSNIDLDAARIVDLSADKELRPMLRTFGFGMPGFRIGHYRLRSGKRGFLLLTATDHVLVLPEHSGRVILLSLERPQALLDALRGKVSA